MKPPVDAHTVAPEREHIFRRALEYCATQRVSEAKSALEELLARNPNDAQALLLLGSILVQSDPEAAETCLTRCIEVTPEEAFAWHNLGKLRQRHDDHQGALGHFARAVALNPDFAPTFNDLGSSLHRLGEWEQALAAFDRAVALDPSYLTAALNRALVLIDLRRTDDAHRVLSGIVATTPVSADDWSNIGVAHYHLGSYEAAVEACRMALALDRTSLAPYPTLALALERLHRNEEACDTRAKWARRQGVIIRPCLGERRMARMLLIGAADLCNLPTDFLIDRAHFETVAINLRCDGGPSDAEIDLAARDCDVVFNVIGDADRGMPYFAAAAAACRRLGRPVLNPPDHIPATRRDRQPARLSDISGLVVPMTRRVARDEAAAATVLAVQHGPVLIRPAGAHGGEDLVRIDEASQIADYLEATPAEAYYVSEYHDFHSADGQYRKYRVIFVDRRVFPYHLAIGPHWLLHYWRVDMSEEMRREEEAFLADYRSIFHGAAGDALAEVARRINLDYAGMDCALLPDGRVLMFEANATMLVHLAEPSDRCAYKRRYVPLITNAMTRLVAERMRL